MLFCRYLASSPLSYETTPLGNKLTCIDSECAYAKAYFFPSQWGEYMHPWQQQQARTWHRIRCSGRDADVPEVSRFGSFKLFLETIDVETVMYYTVRLHNAVASLSKTSTWATGFEFWESSSSCLLIFIFLHPLHSCIPCICVSLRGLHASPFSQLSLVFWYEILRLRFASNNRISLPALTFGFGFLVAAVDWGRHVAIVRCVRHVAKNNSINFFLSKKWLTLIGTLQI